MSATQFLSRLKALFHRSQMQDDLTEELQFHLQNEIEKNIAAGMTAEEARYAALRGFGGVDQIKEQCREDTRDQTLRGILAETFNMACGCCSGTPGFSATCRYLLMALGIGANTSVFSLINMLLLRPLPVKEPDLFGLDKYGGTGRATPKHSLLSRLLGF